MNCLCAQVPLYHIEVNLDPVGLKKIYFEIKFKYQMWLLPDFKYAGVMKHLDNTYTNASIFINIETMYESVQKCLKELDRLTKCGQIY